MQCDAVLDGGLVVVREGLRYSLTLVSTTIPLSLEMLFFNGPDKG